MAFKLSKYSTIQDAVCTLYSEGHTLLEIGHKFKIGHDTVRKILVACQKPIKQGKHPSKEVSIDMAIALLSQGIHQYEVAKKLGVSYTTLRTKLLTHNLKIRDIQWDSRKGSIHGVGVRKT